MIRIRFADEGRTVETNRTGNDVLNTLVLNKGSAWSEEKRVWLGLLGLLPYHISTNRRATGARLPQLPAVHQGSGSVPLPDRSTRPE